MICLFFEYRQLYTACQEITQGHQFIGDVNFSGNNETEYNKKLYDESKLCHYCLDWLVGDANTCKIWAGRMRMSRHIIQLHFNSISAIILHVGTSKTTMCPMPLRGVDPVSFQGDGMYM